MTDVHSSRLQFTRDGNRLVVAQRDRVVVVESPDRAARRELAIDGVQAVAAFADQLWVATTAGALHRRSIDGGTLDEASISIDPDGTLVPTTVGGPSALWTGGGPALFLDDLGRLASIPTDDNAIPIAGRRFARVAGPKLTLPAGTTVILDGIERIAGGCAILDGVSLALVAKHARGRDVHVVAVASGRLLQRIELPAGIVRIAPRRGVAVVQQARDLVLLDLRLGRRLGTIVADQDVEDFAVDPDAKQLALRLRSGEVEIAPLLSRAREAQVGRSRATPDDTAVVSTTEHGGELPDPVEASIEVVPPDAPAIEAPILERETAEPLPHLEEAVAAFEPRRDDAALPRDAALTVLDREIRSATLWTLRAIASAWNTRRIGYGNEGAHPFEHEVAALVGKNTGFATKYVATAEQALAEHEATLAADPRFRASSPLAEIVDEFGLSSVATEVLLVVAAPSIDGDLARLYGILANDTSRSVVDELLVQHVLAGRASRHDIASELHPHAPLVRFGLVDLKSARPRPFTSLEVDSVILSRLRAESPDLGGLRVRAADRDLATLDLPRGVLAAAAEALTRTMRPARIAVRGRAGTGRRALLAALAARAYRSLGVIDATALPRDVERFTDALRRALRRAQLAALVPVVHGLEDVVFGERDGMELAREPLAAHPGPVAVLVTEGTSPPLPCGHAVIDLHMLSEAQRLDVWQRALACAGQWSRDPASLASRYRVGPGVIHNAIAAVGGGAGVPCDDQVETYLRHARGQRVGQHARRVERLASWNDLVLPSDTLDSLRELVGRVRHRRTVFEQWGLGRKMATSRGLTALFQGPPGTGKTLVAGIVARELGLDLYQVDLSKVMSKWIGETERNLAKIFDAADDGQAILLFDEADSLFAKRTEVRSSNDRYANLEVNYLLQRLDSFDGIAVLTTNSGGSIDPAFKRRLSFQLSFPFPDEETRAALWRAHLPRELPRAHELTFDALAHKYQLSGGYIRNACLRAAFLAAQEEKPLHQDHLERAVALEFAELGKLSTTGTIA